MKEIHAFPSSVSPDEARKKILNLKAEQAAEKKANQDVAMAKLQSSETRNKVLANAANQFASIAMSLEALTAKNSGMDGVVEKIASLEKSVNDLNTTFEQCTTKIINALTRPKEIVMKDGKPVGIKTTRATVQ